MVFLGYRPRGSWLPAHSEHEEHQEHRFLMLQSPRPGKGLCQQRGKPLDFPNLAAWRGYGPGTLQLIVSVLLTGLYSGWGSAFAVSWVLPIPPSLHGYGDSRFPCS